MFSAKEMPKKLEMLKLSFAKHNEFVHEYFSSAVSLAVYGNLDAINAGHDALPVLYQDALKAWVSPKAAVFGTGAWIRFDKTTKNFALIEKTAHLRPSQEEILAVSKDLTKYMMNKTAKAAANQLSWEDELQKKIEGVQKYANAQGETVPRELLRLIDEFSARAIRVITQEKWRAEDKARQGEGTGVAPPTAKNINIDASAVINAADTIQ